MASLTTPDIHVRLATLQDVDQLADTHVEACIDDQPTHAFCYPWRHKHRNDYRNGIRRQLRLDLRKDLLWVVCAETATSLPPTKIEAVAEDASDDHVSFALSSIAATTPKQPQIVGWAIWTRSTADINHQRTIQSLESTFSLRSQYRYTSFIARIYHTTILYLESTYLFHFVRALLSPATSLHNYLHINTASKDTYLDPNFEEPGEYWYLEELCVRPTTRRRGVGQKLLEWGTKWAEREKLPVLLAASPMGRRMYERSGFKEIGRWRWRIGEGEEADETWPKMMKDS